MAKGRSVPLTMGCGVLGMTPTRAARRDVVAVEGDVEVAGREGAAGESCEQLVDALAEEGAAGVDAHDGEVARRRGSSRGSRERCA